MADTADAVLWSNDARQDGSGHKRSVRSEITDSEKFGREIAPLNALEAARKTPERINMAREERLVSILGGAALAVYGIIRRDRAGWALALTGGGFALRGMTGHCPMYGALSVSTAPGDSRETKGVHVAKTITINKSPEDLYSFWRDFENHALISDYLASVKITGPTTSHWVAKGPANKLLQDGADSRSPVSAAAYGARAEGRDRSYLYYHASAAVGGGGGGIRHVRQKDRRLYQGRSQALAGQNPAYL